MDFFNENYANLVEYHYNLLRGGVGGGGFRVAPNRGKMRKTCFNVIMKTRGRK